MPAGIADTAVRYVLINGAAAWRTDDRLSNYDAGNRRIMAFCQWLERNKIEEIRLFHKYEKEIANWPGVENWYAWQHFHLDANDDF